MAVDSGTMVIQQALFELNSSPRSGGALVINQGGSVTMRTVLARSNEAPIGGAVHIQPGGALDIDTGIFEANSAAAKGGGIYTEQSPIALFNCSFDFNTAAGLGAALYIEEPPSVRIAHSTFFPFESGAGTVFIGGQLGGCNEHPCGAGFECSYEQYSLTCTRCSSTTVSTDGKSCRACRPGTGPTADSTACIPCAGNNISAFGICEPCAAGFASNDAHTQCTDMSDGEVSDPTIVASIVDTSLGGHVVTATIGFTSTASTAPDILGDQAAAAIASELGISQDSIAVAGTDFADESSTRGKITFMVVDDASETLHDILYGLISALHLDSNSSLPALFDRTPPTFSFVCPIGMIRFEGQTVCGRCPWPEFTEDQMTCESCPSNMVPTEMGNNCKCSELYFSTVNEDGTKHSLACHSMDFTKPLEDDAGDHGLQCKSCNGDKFPCVAECQGQNVTVVSGWQMLAGEDGLDTNVFSCPGGAKACPGGPINNSNSCGIGYSGMLCAACAPGFHEVSDECVPCEGMTPVGTATIVVSLVFVVVLAWKVKVWYNYFT